MSYLRGRMDYYAQGDQWPYPQGSGGPYRLFLCAPHLDNPPFQSFPVSQPGAICAAGSTKLNFYRPNQALVRGVVRGGRMAGFSDDRPSLLLQIAEIGIGLFAVGLLTGKSGI